MKIFFDENIHQHVLQALKRYAPKEWPRFMVVMRDAVQSTWKVSL